MHSRYTTPGKEENRGVYALMKAGPGSQKKPAPPVEVRTVAEDPKPEEGKGEKGTEPPITESKPPSAGRRRKTRKSKKASRRRRTTRRR